jgi:hypothetical protein
MPNAARHVSLKKEEKKKALTACSSLTARRMHHTTFSL